MNRQNSDGWEKPRSLFAVSVGAAYVCCVDVLGLLDSPTHLTIYHFAGPASALFVPALLDMVILAAAVFAVLLASRRLRRVHRAVWAVIFCALPWVALKNVAFLLNWTVSHWLSLGVFSLSALAFLLLTFVTGARASAVFDRVRTAASIVLKLVAVAGIVAVAQAAFFFFKARNLNAQPADHSTAIVSETKPRKRIVWIVFDELAFRQLYEHRPAGLSLPAFDRFAAQGTVFKDVKPAGMYTDIVLPSLMTGVSIEAIRASSDGRHLRMQQKSDARWVPFEQQDTVFNDAQKSGYGTAAIGWYNPYCRMLPDVLTSCYWTGQTELSDLYPSRTVGANLVHPMARFFEKLPSFLHPPAGPSADEITEGNLHIDDYVSLRNAADTALEDPRLDFLLLHLPIPHPSGIWDRERKTFAVNHSSYVDNLALADIYLAHVHDVLDGRHEWDEATVVIMGDHSWRTKLLWTGTRPWNADDEAASDHGKFDDRPAYLIKLSGQKSPLTINTQFSAVGTRKLLDALVSGEIAKPEQLAAWVQLQAISQ